MSDLLKAILFFGAGYLTARYLIFKTDDYKQKETELIDSARNKLHDLLKDLDPQADDETIASTVLEILPEK